MRDKKGECSTMRYFERDHICITVITGCYCILLVIIVNLSYCLIYKLNFIIGMNVKKKNILSTISCTYWGFWNASPEDGGDHSN